jgi:hypothetical protein
MNLFLTLVPENSWTGWHTYICTYSYDHMIICMYRVYPGSDGSSPGMGYGPNGWVVKISGEPFLRQISFL